MQCSGAVAVPRSAMGAYLYLGVVKLVAGRADMGSVSSQNLKLRSLE